MAARSRQETTPAAYRPVAIPAPEAATSGLESLSTEDLRRELSAALEWTAHALRRLAEIVRILESRGEDLSDLRQDVGFLGYLRRIAHRQVLPEVVVRFVTSPMLIQRIGQLPLPDQARLAAGEPIPLVVLGPDGRTDLRLADPLKMGRSQVAQVFGPDGLRDQAAQLLAIEAKRRAETKARRPGSIARVGALKVDRRNRGIVVGGEFVPVARVVEALALLAVGDDEAGDDDGRAAAIVTHLTAAQHTALKDAANRGRTSVAALVRRALAAYGLFRAGG